MKFLKYILKYRWQIILLFIGLCLQVWSSLELPDMMGQIVNKGIIGGDKSFITTESIFMLIITLIGGIGMLVSGYFAAKIGASLAKVLRKDIYQKTMSFSVSELNKFSTSSLITRSTNDITQIQMVTTMVLRMSLQAPLIGVGSVLKALGTAPEMTWIIMLAVASLFVVIITIFCITIPKFNILQKLVDKLNLVARENLTGLRVVRAFNNEKIEEKKFDNVNTDLTKLNLFVNKAIGLMFPFVQLIVSFVTLLIIWIGAKYIEINAIEIGNMMAFLQYAMQVMMSFMFLTMLFILIPRGAVSWKRIREVLDTDLSIKFPTKSEKYPGNLKGEVEFKNVSFRYFETGELILKNISFKTKIGETTAFIGSTGAGKSTLLNLIPRFYDVSEGNILVDGVDVRDYAQEDLMKKIGFVPQKNILFSGTILGNINFGTKNLSLKEVKESSKIAQANDFIEKLDKGYNSHVAQGGTNLSGGQKQRLSIARAIAKKPEIYLFDDSFSALDFKTDLALRKALKKNTKNSSVLVVAQRVGTIKDAEQIIVLEKGEIVGIGKHLELLKNCDVYRKIAESQLSEEELKI